MTDTSPEALDRLIERLLRANMIICDGTPETDDHGYVDGNLGKEAADTIRALRAAPVAMRERAARWHDLQSDAAMGNLSSDSAGHDYRHAHKTADFHKTCAAAIRALPLDAPASTSFAQSVGETVARFDRLSEAKKADYTRTYGRPAPTEPHKSVLDGNEAPAPVDPVAEAARVLQRWRDKRIADALDKNGPGAAVEIAHESSMKMLARALAQETRHD